MDEGSEQHKSQLEGADLETVEREENVRHLELIQAIISRLATNSFLIKGWCLTLAAASFGFAVNRVDWRIVVPGAVVVLAFWFLDSYYLRQERLFRLLYNHVRRGPGALSRFSMNVSIFRDFAIVGRWRVFRSSTLWVFYGVLLVAGGLVACLAMYVR